MFDVEKAITEWREQMLAAGIQTPVPLEELESHLREEIERLMRSGLPEQSAFEAAIQKFGKANMLNDEFEKVRVANEARDWKLKQFLFAGSLSVISPLIAGLLIFKFGDLKEITWAQQMSGLAALAMMILFAVGGRLAYGFFPVIHSKRTRDVICGSIGVIVIFCLIIIFNVVLPRIDFTMCQLAVAILWAMMPAIGILGGLIAGIETAAWKKYV